MFRIAALVLILGCSEVVETPIGCVTWTYKLDPTVQITECDFKYNPQLIVDGIRVTPGYTYEWVSCDQCQ
jgi:hypothetical protein